MEFHTPNDENHHVIRLSADVRVYDAADTADAVASVEAIIERVNGVKLDDGVIVQFDNIKTDN